MLVLFVFLIFSGGTSGYRITKELNEDDFAVIETKEEYGNDQVLLEPDVVDLLEGDIAVSELQKNIEAQENAGGITKRNAIRNHRYLWHDRVIPFEIHSDLSAHTALINQAFKVFHDNTCLRFVAKDSSHTKWLRFEKKTGCWSYIGKLYSAQGAQTISIGPGCEHLSVILHEIMHAIGFYHEQSRPDRDKFVEIFWENIIPEKIESNFKRQPAKDVDTLGVDYDFNSIVHYAPNAFSQNGKLTITAINDPTNTKDIGKKDTMTPSDFIKINTLYSCGCLSSSSLGAEDKSSLPDGNFVSSSTNSLPSYKASNGRLNNAYAWCGTGAADEYLQVDLGKEENLCSVASQGSNLFSDWVKTYSVRYSSDGSSWSQIQESDGSEKVYNGNSDQQTVVNHKFTKAIPTRYVRFYPKTSEGSRCMRIGLYRQATYLSAWSSYTPCDRQTCKKERQRFCSSDNKASDCPDADVHGVETQKVDCTQAECTAPIDGHWARWSPWGECEACGLGNRKRTRFCTDPAPSFNGKACVGSNTTAVQCRIKHCGMGSDGCSFSNDFCTWKVSPFGQTDWQRKQGSTPSGKTGPSGDATAPDNSGHYIYLEASNIAIGANAVLRSAVQPGLSSQRCVKFQYHMYDDYNGDGYMGTLAVKTQNIQTGDQTTLQTISGNRGNQWHSQEVTFSSSSDFMVIFEAIRGKQFVSDIAVDDVYLLWGACSSATDENPEPNKTPSTETFEDTCDFEKDFGNWQNSVSQDRQFDWTRHKDDTATPLTGPSGDHTTRAGYYAYIETSEPRTIGQRARLVSKEFSQEYRCMSVWYHMNGAAVWQLNVIKKTSSKEILLWSANTHAGDKWLHGIIPLTTGSGSFNIIIEGVRGRYETGDIAIDDITVGKEACSTLLPSTSDPASKKDCNFDSNQCAWVDVPGGNMYWLNHAGATSNADTGPASGQSGSGYYMYINSASPRKTGDKALIASPYFNPGASGQCFKFWYHMHGSEVGTLEVKKETLSSAQPTSLLKKTSSQGNAWQTASVFVSGNENTRIVIEGIIGGQGKSDIAIDDVTFTSGSC